MINSNNQDEDLIIEFNRSKIFEKLDIIPEPQNYSSKISWVVQNQIAATNGVHYADRIGKLNEYPIYELPVKNVSGQKLMLDIGCGWGRWLIAGANKGYIPVGVDIRLEFCETAIKVVHELGKPGYVVVGDLENLPFKDNLFNLVWSFSVVQHTHYLRLINCLNGINKILRTDGTALLEFPNKNGLRNQMGNVQSNHLEKDDYNSWSVRYYTIQEYRDIFKEYLTNFSYRTHSFLGIGVLKEDLKYVTLKNKILCAVSLLLSATTKVLPPLTHWADSLYISANKKESSNQVNQNLTGFFNAHHSSPKNNLNIIHILKCPKYGGELIISNDGKKIISQEAGIYYPVINNVPILISSEAITI